MLDKFYIMHRVRLEKNICFVYQCGQKVNWFVLENILVCLPVFMGNFVVLCTAECLKENTKPINSLEK